MKPAAAPSTAPTDSVRDRHARRLGFLERLAEAGMEAARALVAQVAARVTEDFERIAKAIRLAILLRHRLEEEGPGLSAAPAASAPPLSAPPPDHAERGESVARPPSVEREARESTGDAWLDRDDDTELDTVPVAVLVQRLCEILGVPYEPDLWADAIAPIGAEGAPAKLVSRPVANRTLWREPPARPLRSPADPRPRPSG